MFQLLINFNNCNVLFQRLLSDSMITRSQDLAIQLIICLQIHQDVYGKRKKDLVLFKAVYNHEMIILRVKMEIELVMLKRGKFY